MARRRRAAHGYAHLTPSTMYTYVYIHIIFFITGRQDSLVLDHEQHDDCSIFDGHGRHDSGADAVAGHRPL